MGFPRLLSIFYCTFHPIQGPKVLYEVPEGSILSKSSPLVDFDSISEYLIPKVELCSKLVTISTPTCKVIGFPVNLEHKKFQRNALMFNLAFVFDKDAETSSYEPVVRKMARVLKALEKESEFLSRQTRLAMMGSGSLVNATLPAIAPSTPATVASTANSFHAANVASGKAAAVGTSMTELIQSNNGNSGNGILEMVTESAASFSSTDANGTTTALGQPQTINGTSLSSSFLTSSGLSVPMESASPIPVPQTTQQGTSTITSNGIVSSPPSITNSSITLVLTAPPSSSPFPQSKLYSVSNSNSATSAANGVSSATTAQKGMPSPSSLLAEEQADGSGMQNLIEQLIEDLNSYCECQIPIDSANTINLKLFPTYPNPAPVYDYQVPISTVNLEALADVNWDMTMQRITVYINGVNSVKRIAEYADVETALARMCMQHLLYYGCIIMVDLFQFKNIYAVKLEMMRLTEDVALQNECVSYVTLPDMHAPSFAKIFSLYCSLQYGVVLQDWIEQNQIADYNIDVRRFISFGVIKGFLYRVHKYPILDYHDPASALGINSASSNSKSIETSATSPASAVAVSTPSATAGNATAITSRPGTPSTMASVKKTYGDSMAPNNQGLHYQNHHSNEHPAASVAIPPALKKLLNGGHHYDELCTMFGCSVRQMDEILASDTRVKFIYR
ncbi:nitrogen permease regulator 2-domain-containing protein [Gamsiella multidivaricata]|uniref:nitrogen permease regulator 2-domain-containing protein n=1 Tax=Gamsiella multidivaricata TaxID=101098 RepID=UPI0022200053|nr:nitrogen permease regulator 2-domain-containing protein [Gamsiella multidivaricata]KAI7832399.1 nitrogen permease regulator 2-domain-containing protein [Gamsiella multidivaricata]